jgi:hypothetical protein
MQGSTARPAVRPRGDSPETAANRPTVSGDATRGLVLEGEAIAGGAPLASGGFADDPEGFWALLERAVDLGARPVGPRRPSP